MPIYTCTVTESTLTAGTKLALAREMARIHASVYHVPSTYVNVAFHELPADAVYTDGASSSPVLVSGWVRAGHPEAETTRLATEIAAAATRITGIAAERVLVVIESSPARFAIEGGRVLPEPGHEQAWIAGSG
jgi:phenylpyruvate tautomerase PptA (4-oxalocrotonate tautomerase family)